MTQLTKEYVMFPNGQEYTLVPEENTIWKSGLQFPSEIEEKALFIAGLCGTGKSTLVSKLCEEDKKKPEGQVLLTLSSRPKIQFCPIRENLSCLNDLVKWKVIDGHFIFELPRLTGKPVFAHKDPVCSADYDFLKIGEQFEFDNSVKKKFIFEIRQLSPTLIEDFRKQRYEEQISKGISSWNRHSYTSRTPEEIQKGQYLYYQAAHKLFEQGIDVYIRTSLDGAPLRFLN
jgi:hypothetical protein